MKLHELENYEDYVKAQTAINLKKLDKVWVKKQDILEISKIVEKPKNIICHGTRRGVEQQHFIDIFPNAYVIGTEISHTAKNFKNTIQHDFHITKEEWVEKFDLLYSNSFDHTYDPKLCLSSWISQIRVGGYIAIDFSLRKDVNNVDMLSLTCEEADGLMSSNNIEKIKSYITNQNSYLFVGKK